MDRVINNRVDEPQDVSLIKGDTVPVFHQAFSKVSLSKVTAFDAPMYDDASWLQHIGCFGCSVQDTTVIANSNLQ